MSENKRISLWQRLLFGGLKDKNHSRKIAYIAVMTAFAVVSNMFFEFKLADTQFSLTLAVSALTGILIGPCFGFVACFLGDLVGFLYHSAGYPYYPWIGISIGLTAFLFGLCVALKPRGKGWLYISLIFAATLTFLLCTVAINTTSFWILYSKRKTPYWTYLTTRLFVEGQIFNSLINYALVLVVAPVLTKLKALQLGIE